MLEKISGKALYEWRQWAIQLAQDNEIDLAEVDWFLQGLTGISSLSLRFADYRPQPEIPIKLSLENLTAKWQQRITYRVPVQYLTGETPWRNFSLSVSPDVLIPRPETELIIDIAKNLVEQSPIQAQLSQGHWADLGTGSGAIALGLAHTFPQATIHAVDISKPALAIAQQNAQQNNLADRITFYPGSWLSPLPPFPFCAIISNPPYIPSQTVLTLQSEVTNHEPHLALDGGRDGLDAIKTLITASVEPLLPNGIWLVELMSGQAETVVTLLNQQGQYSHIRVHQDLSGIDRFVSARKAL
ncbi:MAG: peptide chain release factor N(5)-glutamine methyltransferase [Phormidesmis sp. RL_2_1]|nr:peptide chain release factor N(5)-glutamine methyltransferase [Phormidesmis sp. RL_2_1]